MKRCILFFLLALSLKAHSQDYKEILSEYFNAIGGVDNWKDVHSVYSVVYSSDSKDKSVNDRVKQVNYEKLPNFSCATIYSSDGSRSQVYLNDKKSGSVLYGQFFEMANLFNYITIDPAVLVRDLYVHNRFKYLREASDSIGSYHVLGASVDPMSNEQAEYFFDKNSHLLAYVVSNGSDRAQLYKDYRWVGPRRTPFAKELRNAGALVHLGVTESIEFNPSVTDSIYYYSSKKPVRPYVLKEPSILTFTDGSFQDLLQSNYKGERVFVDLWATWCAPCKVEFNRYDSVYFNFMKKSKIKLLFISIDNAKDKKVWLKEINGRKMGHDHLLAGPKLLKSIHSAVYGDSAIVIPRYILINEYGKILSTSFTRPSDPSFKSDIGRIFK